MKTALALLTIIFGAISAWFLVAACSVQTAVASTDAPAGYDGIANLQAMHFQMADIVLGVGAGVVAAILLGALAVVDAMPTRDRLN